VRAGMIGVLIMAHDGLGDSLADAVTHVLGAKPPQFDVFPVAATDDPIALLPKARNAVAALDTGDGVAILSDIYGATPCNLAVKLADAGHVEVLAGVSLPMLVRAFTYRTRGMETFVKKAVSGGCEGVLHVDPNPIYAAARSRDR
jgi:PTS system ascorbate-specific IIA component